MKEEKERWVEPLRYEAMKSDSNEPEGVKSDGHDGAAEATRAISLPPAEQTKSDSNKGAAGATRAISASCKVKKSNSDEGAEGTTQQSRTALTNREDEKQALDASCAVTKSNRDKDEGAEAVIVKRTIFDGFTESSFSFVSDKDVNVVFTLFLLESKIQHCTSTSISLIDSLRFFFGGSVGARADAIESLVNTEALLGVFSLTASTVGFLAVPLTVGTLTVFSGARSQQIRELIACKSRLHDGGPSHSLSRRQSHQLGNSSGGLRHHQNGWHVPDYNIATRSNCLHLTGVTRVLQSCITTRCGLFSIATPHRLRHFLTSRFPLSGTTNGSFKRSLFYSAFFQYVTTSLMIPSVARRGPLRSPVVKGTVASDLSNSFSSFLFSPLAHRFSNNMLTGWSSELVSKNNRTIGRRNWDAIPSEETSNVEGVGKLQWSVRYNEGDTIDSIAQFARACNVQ
ncbi:hypothetical protein M5K25_010969 [Dendrobium thyrsiflorum]|uniref:Uncharacterized protein n=1 Tax=Dendrobium thyrsiflorum TaxID=117978 RepID=A0ABD0V8Q3_DENTH